MDIKEEISVLLDKWERRAKYLEETIRVEEAYGDNSKIPDVLYARKDELCMRGVELQGLLNKLHSTTSSTTSKGGEG